MRALVVPGDRGGCGHYRMIWPAEALKDQGADVHVLGEHEHFIDGVFQDTTEGERLVDIVDPPDVDVIVLQRCVEGWRADLVQLLQAKGIAVVVEVDDDFTRIDPRNIAYGYTNPETSPSSNWQHLLRACEHADMVTVSTPALAGTFAPHGRVQVLPNCVPARYLNIRHEWSPGSKLKVGWTGSIDTHPGDLESTDGAVADIMAEQSPVATFVVVGTGKGVQHALELHYQPKATGWLDIARYPKAVAQFDVGIVPLRACAFNRAKSWLKGLEMAAVGVPFVASPTPEYERLAKLGAGALVGRTRDWTRELRRLMVDAAYRIEKSEQGRAVAATWTIEGNCIRWLEAWTNARAERMAA